MGVGVGQVGRCGGSPAAEVSHARVVGYCSSGSSGLG